MSIFRHNEQVMSSTKEAGRSGVRSNLTGRVGRVVSGCVGSGWVWSGQDPSKALDVLT